jgi:L-lysine 6-transaminase
MTTTTAVPIAPADVHATLARYILADGYEIVFDFEKSRGAWVHDSKSGRDYLDFLTFFGSNPIGYNHPKMKDPDFQRMLVRVAQLKPSNSDVYSVEYAWFVDTFGRLAMPKEMKHAFFVEGGALGVENALKVAFDWKVRRNKARGVAGEKGAQVVHFREAFHGRSGYTLSLTNTDPRKTDYFPKFPWPRIDNPKLRFPVTAEVEADVRAAEERALDQVRQAFRERGDDIACIVIEPIQAEGGDNHFRPAFLQSLQRLARENDCLFVVDEVQTGLGLTGRLWAYQHFGLEPDVLAFGKKVQVGGCMASARVDEVPDNVFKTPSRINSTWGGSITDMVRSGRYLEIIAEDKLVDNARVVGEHLLRGLEALQAELGGVISNARGRGLMIAFDLATPEVRDKAHKRLIESGLLLLTCGARSIRFRPPLNLTAAEADAAMDIARKALRQI